MNLRTITIAACMVLLLGSYAHADSAATAASDQMQGQSQTQIGGVGSATAVAGQGQSQYTGGSSSSSAGGSVVDSGKVLINESFNGAAPIRYLPVPSAIPYENYQGQIFGGPDYQDKGPNFISMRQLVAVLNLVDLDVPVEGEKNIRILTQMMMVPPEPVEGEVAEQDIEDAAVTFEINDGEAVNHGFTPIAVLSVAMEKPDKSNSASLAVAIGKHARSLGAKRVVFLTEGSSKKIYSSGWGIGLSYNYATVGSKASDNGSVGAGGTGYSQGSAGYKNLVYLTAIVGK